jgi:hypothetical protein
MKDYNFSCQNCDEPFTIFLPEQTTKTAYSEVCEDDDLKTSQSSAYFTMFELQTE